MLETKRERAIPRRFPRQLAGEAAGFLTALLWQTPKFSVVVAKKKNAFIFKFRIPVHDTLRGAYPEIWNLFFGEGIDDWKKALSYSYWDAKWGDKKLSHSVSNHLRLVYKNALNVWFKSYLSTSKDEDKKAEQLSAFRASARIQRLQPDPRIAMWAAWRFECLQPAIKELRIKLKKGSQRGNAALVRTIRAQLPTPIAPQRALGLISDEQGDGACRANFARISDGAIAEAYIKCELEDLHYVLGKPSLKTYIRVGTKIRDSLSKRILG